MLLQSAVLAWVPLLLGLAGLDVGVDLHKIIRVSVGRDNFHTWGGSDAPEENIAYAAANLFADSAREFAACLEGDDDIDLDRRCERRQKVELDRTETGNEFDRRREGTTGGIDPIGRLGERGGATVVSECRRLRPRFVRLRSHRALCRRSRACMGRWRRGRPGWVPCRTD